ncbi:MULTISPECIES: fused MFS/spermidine synthase [unclassified Bradyrhizobium]|uniref:fused MFS/spermidine synthase n=1 Tax=unclassified Bradyrhizobium TaxID=2631580 RepID=UPI0028ECA047|nr:MULTISPECIES: fused MFS/spermidine synthase [unclassified Bradyrhizobium]
MSAPVSRSGLLAIYLCSFLVGCVLMGFEMLGSRYLNPYFGSGIGAWASLISTVLCALAIGYFAGSAIVDRQPTTRTIGTMILIAAAYMALVPATADIVMADILDTVGDGPAATLMASTALLLVPLTLLGTFSPIAVSLLTRSADEAGRVAGLVYGVSTIGNVVGTLVTTFALIPTIGSRAITYYFAVALAGCAGILFIPFGKKTS